MEQICDVLPGQALAIHFAETPMRTVVICSDGRIPRWSEAPLAQLLASHGFSLAGLRSEPGAYAPMPSLFERWALPRISGLAPAPGPTMAGATEPGAELTLDLRLDPTAPAWHSAPMVCLLAIEDRTGLEGLRAAFDGYCRNQPFVRFAWRLLGSGPPRVLRDGAVRASASFAQGIDELLAVAGHALVGGLRSLERAGATKPVAAEPATAPVGPAGAASLAASYGRRTWRRGARFAEHNLKFEKWSPGVCPVPVERFLGLETLPQTNWLPEPAGLCYYADPFPLPGCSDRLLAERYSAREGRGTIVALDTPSARTGKPATVIARDHHLSYPYLIEDGDRLYCVPEAAESGCITLFELERGSGRWREASVLVRFPGVDPTFFQHGGRWWMVCTSRDDPAEPGACTLLYAWHAPSLEGPWQPHRGNPVKTDVRSSRPAGPPFRSGGRLFRPAQDCAATYGAALSIVEITKLDENEYEERMVTRIAPDPHGPYPAGIHTMVAAGDATIVDGKRFRIAPQLLAIRLGKKLLRTRQSATSVPLTAEAVRG
jgi:hypothetical protein